MSIQDVVWRTSRERWTIESGGEKGSGRSVLSAWHHDDDDKYLGILEADTIKQVELIEKIKKEYLRRTRKLPETKIWSRNLIKEISTWVVSLVIYPGPFLKWDRKELKQIDRRTRELMTMHKALHHRNYIDRLYVSRKEGGRGLTSIEDSVDASIQRLKDCIEKRGEGLIQPLETILTARRPKEQ